MLAIAGLGLLMIGLVWCRSQFQRFKRDPTMTLFWNIFDWITTEFPTVMWAVYVTVAGIAMIVLQFTQ